MFIPDIFKFEDITEKIAFIKQYSFASIITVKDGLPIATHLPFAIDDSSEKLILTSHFAAANEQAKFIEESISLIIFSEPHAYISPTHYDKIESVPTWDYITVHAYGKAKIITDENLKYKALEKMIMSYEQSYKEQWDNLPDKFKKGMMRGITAFEFEVTDLQGQKKLSQNKSETERQRIIQNLEKNINTVEKDLARFIRDSI
ncbi:FMN-binding negative transcriptional regulator [Flavobacterium sp. Root186]|uniref:FMN-binding negative transcriptional regulator n=1 Tax=Flavobacterium sp. Root186 TaxID=1736485 RepID=UPI0006F83688|nr:FMN-binding negative transcriptional regulator [Flavobacterium sp. Root186]KRB55504.1 transcriptional regulator [Flavobacterium sp. Root186]